MQVQIQQFGLLESLSSTIFSTLTIVLGIRYVQFLQQLTLICLEQWLLCLRKILKNFEGLELVRQNLIAGNYQSDLLYCISQSDRKRAMRPTNEWAQSGTVYLGHSELKFCGECLSNNIW
jgi:hypothetical protein